MGESPEASSSVVEAVMTFVSSNPMGEVGIVSVVLSSMIGETPDISVIVVESLIYVAGSVILTSIGPLVMTNGVVSGVDESPDVSITVVESLKNVVASVFISTTGVVVTLPVVVTLVVGETPDNSSVEDSVTYTGVLVTFKERGGILKVDPDIDVNLSDVNNPSGVVSVLIETSSLMSVVVPNPDPIVDNVGSAVW